MDVLVKRLDVKLRESEPNIAAQDALDIMRSRAVEQEVLDLLDEPISR